MTALQHRKRSEPDLLDEPCGRPKAAYFRSMPTRGAPAEAEVDRPTFESEHFFCSNPACVLHVRAGDPGVQGSGNWAELAGGVVIGRSRYDGTYLCDRCVRVHQSGTVRDA